MRLIFTLLFSAFIICSQAQPSIPDLNKFPAYESVVQHFKTNYSTSFSSGIQIQFARKPFGWYIELYDLSKDPSTPYQSNLLWSYNRKQYQQLPLKGATKDDNPYWQPYDYDYMTTSFSIHPFFGYKKWSADLIEIYEPIENKSDSILYVLGRAYSNLASLSLWPYDSYFRPDRYDTTFNKEDINPDSVRLFIEREEKSISYFKKTFDQNHLFSTVIGNIYTKYSNEYMYAYSILQTLGFAAEARSFIKEGLYDEFILATAKNYLISCPPNSVLVTGGDNDTYSILYVQELFRYRKDVIIASALMNTARFIHFMRLSGLVLNISDQQYQQLENRVVLLKDDEPFVSADDELTAIAAFTFKKQQDWIELKSSNIMFNLYASDVNNTQKLTSFTASFKQPYLYASDLFLIDLIKNNFSVHPLCFATSCPDYIYEAYKENLEHNGLVYRLILNNGDDQTQLQMNAYEKLLLNEYEYHFVHRDNSTFEHYIYNYKYQFLSAAQLALTLRDTNTAVRFTNRYLELFTPQVLPYGDTEVTLLEILIKANQINAANEVAEMLLNQANKFIVAQMKYSWETIPDPQGVALWIYICDSIKGMAAIKEPLKTRAGIYYDSLLPFYH